MMLYPPGEDAFLTNVQEGAPAYATVTRSDDLCIVIDTIRAKLDPLGITPYITWSHDGQLQVQAKAQT